jgi:hypothetical protein
MHQYLRMTNESVIVFIVINSLMHRTNQTSGLNYRVSGVRTPPRYFADSDSTPRVPIAPRGSLCCVLQHTMEVHR